jgi:hypothetical protein
MNQVWWHVPMVPATWEAIGGMILVHTCLSKITRLHLKNNWSKKSWECGSSGEIPIQVRGPKFKSQYHQKQIFFQWKYAKKLRNEQQKKKKTPLSFPDELHQHFCFCFFQEILVSMDHPWLSLPPLRIERACMGHYCALLQNWGVESHLSPLPSIPIISQKHSLRECWLTFPCNKKATWTHGSKGAQNPL